MVSRTEHGAAGGRPPAVRVSGPDWRERRDRPVYRVELWPNQSLTRGGLKAVLAIAAAGLALPLMPVMGTPVALGLVPFLLAALWGLWYAIRRNRGHLAIHETLTVWPDEVRVERRDPDGRLRRWRAEPMAVRLHLHKDARIEDYLTLTGGGREIELGAFLAPEERVALAGELEAALTNAIRGLR